MKRRRHIRVSSRGLIRRDVLRPGPAQAAKIREALQGAGLL